MEWQLIMLKLALWNTLKTEYGAKGSMEPEIAKWGDGVARDAWACMHRMQKEVDEYKAANEAALKRRAEREGNSEAKPIAIRETDKEN